LNTAAAAAALDASIFTPQSLVGALEESARLLGYDYFGLISARMR